WEEVGSVGLQPASTPRKGRHRPRVRQGVVRGVAGDVGKTENLMTVFLVGEGGSNTRTIIVLAACAGSHMRRGLADVVEDAEALTMVGEGVVGASGEVAGETV